MAFDMHCFADGFMETTGPDGHYVEQAVQAAKDQSITQQTLEAPLEKAAKDQSITRQTLEAEERRVAEQQRRVAEQRRMENLQKKLKRARESEIHMDIMDPHYPQGAQVILLPDKERKQYNLYLQSEWPHQKTFYGMSVETGIKGYIRIKDEGAKAGFVGIAHGRDKGSVRVVKPQREMEKWLNVSCADGSVRRLNYSQWLAISANVDVMLMPIVQAAAVQAVHRLQVPQVPAQIFDYDGLPSVVIAVPSDLV